MLPQYLTSKKRSPTPKFSQQGTRVWLSTTLLIKLPPTIDNLTTSSQRRPVQPNRSRLRKNWLVSLTTTRL